uniref:Uncharacterized protein n=1 Tax=Glossina pallidipes TaxID=7398 RepID=A0A1B0AAI7_GLOPL
MFPINFVLYVIHEKVAKPKMLTKVDQNSYIINSHTSPSCICLQKQTNVVIDLLMTESQSGLKFLQSISSSVCMKIFKSAVKCRPLQDLKVDRKSCIINKNENDPD